MKTLHIFYTAQSIPHRCISQSLYNAGAEDMEIQTVNVFGRLFDFTERAKPKNVFFSICDFYSINLVEKSIIVEFGETNA